MYTRMTRPADEVHAEDYWFEDEEGVMLCAKVHPMAADCRLGLSGLLSVVHLAQAHNYVAGLIGNREGRVHARNDAEMAYGFFHWVLHRGGMV